MPGAEQSPSAIVPSSGILNFLKFEAELLFTACAPFSSKWTFLQCSRLAFCMSRSENAESGNLAETPGKVKTSCLSLSLFVDFFYSKTKKRELFFKRTQIPIIFILKKRSPLLGLGTKMRPFCSDESWSGFLVIPSTSLLHHVKDQMDPESKFTLQ